VLVLASITESLANFATDLVDKIGLAGVFILMTLESACIPIPSEATMLFAGFNVARGEYSLIVATLVGASANLVGSWIAYGVGYFGRIELVERHGRKLHISPKHLATADRWFCAVMGPTLPNRYYWHGGSSEGKKDNLPPDGGLKVTTSK